MQALTGVLSRLYPDGDWPKPFHVLRAVELVHAGLSLTAAARTTGTSAAKLQSVLKAPEPATALFGERIEIVEDVLCAKARANIGQLLVGRAAEIAFEDIYREHVQPTEFELRDVREGRTSTDYRVHNGAGRPLYRINVKFFRPLFRRSREMVGLEAPDCFPLATYKIKQALDRQDAEHLPYIFLIVGVAELSVNDIGQMITQSGVEFLARVARAKIGGLRNLEDRLLALIVRERSSAFVAAYERIRRAPWYVLSARRAEKLLHDRLFQRVFALRVPRFAQQWRNAEVDMHFSLADDLMPLERFLRELRQDGPHPMTGKLERGTV